MAPAVSVCLPSEGVTYPARLYEALGKAVDVELVGRQVHVPCASGLSNQHLLIGHQCHWPAGPTP